MQNRTANVGRTTVSRSSEPPRNGGASKNRGGSKMKPAVLIAVIVLAFLILAGGVAAFVAFGSRLEDVAQPAANDITADSVTLSWKPIDKADGYHIFSRKAGDSSYVQAGTVDDPNGSAYTVTGLEQAGEYSFYITAFNERTESKNFTPLDGVYTLPAAPEISSAKSDPEGVIYLEWTLNDKADGYYIEYRTDEEGSQLQNVWIDSNTNQTKLEGIDSTQNYLVSIAAYVNRNDKLVSTMSAEKYVEGAVSAALPDPDPQSDYIDPSKPMIALTFDDGPLEGTSGGRILDVLEKYNAKATFFMVGCNVADNAANVQRKAALGMELGNHTWNHKSYGDDVTANDIQMASDAIYAVTGQYPTAFRSPGGMTTDAILAECAMEGMPAYFWSVDTKDWESLNANAVYKEVMDHLADGDIILMHEIHDSTAEAVERLVPMLIHQGYQLVTCHDLVTYKTGYEPTPGYQYTFLGE